MRGIAFDVQLWLVPFSSLQVKAVVFVRVGSSTTARDAFVVVSIPSSMVHPASQNTVGMGKSMQSRPAMTATPSTTMAAHLSV